MKTKILTLIVCLFIFSACSEKDYLVTIKTEYGDMHAILYDDTPLHKENFIKLINDGFYDSLLFHRVMEDFMIQGGDPGSRNSPQGAPLGTGGPDYKINAEFVPSHFHKKGALSAARQPDNMNPERKSSGSQFFIVQGEVYTKDQLNTDQRKLSQMAQRAMEQSDTLAQYFAQVYQNQGPEAYIELIFSMRDSLKSLTNIDYHVDVPADRAEVYTTLGGYPPLDDEYTVFGEVIDGLEIIDKIAAVDTDQRDRPIEDVKFTISGEEVSKSKITKDYGYQFPESPEK